MDPSAPPTTTSLDKARESVDAEAKDKSEQKGK